MKKLWAIPLFTLTGLLAACSPTPTPAVDQRPTISLDASPATVTAAGNITLTATVSDDKGVKMVRFYQGSTLLCEDTTAAYTCTAPVTVSNNGEVTYRAVVTDSTNQTAEATDTVTVNIPVADTTAPLLATVDVLRNSATSYTVNATATDNVAVTKIEFYLDGTLLVSDPAAPYTTNMTFTAAQNGTHTLLAKAYDAAGNTSTASQTFAVSIDNVSPAVTVQAAPLALSEPGSVTISANAIDDQAVTKVEFYDNGTLVATDTTAPYAATVNYTGAANGTHTLTARAYDAQGNTAEASVSVTVNVDVTAPVVTGTATPALLTMPGTVNFAATASDDRAVSKVEFYDNGVLFATDTTAPYEASKAYAFADNGAHSITFKAYDAQNNVGQASSSVNVAITDANEPNSSPATATPLTVGTAINGTIAGTGRDYDYFKFDAIAGAQLRLTVKSVSVDPTSTLDPYVVILMPDGVTVLEKDDDSGTGLESDILFNAPVSGTYTVVLTSYTIQETPTATDNLATNTYQILLSNR
ncbi:Ig-like domain-containing protein [Deinococcus daejeonensis]|uniref:Peptidase domain protein n=1 Tax=Deinococcus daejeonensis TaxID=1007098 RepID=A0ABQ2J1T4_9DEIO|nr:Ig-like domain-containing protein [Deinococcus daejeonensis]GGN34888.1 hypothetical protein GCM10010842_14110 [Deinococcus daejeonensis]